MNHKTDLYGLINFIPEDPEDEDWKKFFKLCDKFIPGFRASTSYKLWSIDFDVNEIIDYLTSE